MPVSISQWSCLIWLCQSPHASLCPPVPIIPSYLYNLDESTDTVLKNTTSQQGSPGAFNTIVSLYDNTVRSSGSNGTAASTNQIAPTTSVPELPQNYSDCPGSSKKLLNENVKVGMLFASKATVQLITNPFIGPLTNRWVFVISVLCGGISYVALTPGRFSCLKIFTGSNNIVASRTKHFSHVCKSEDIY